MTSSTCLWRRVLHVVVVFATVASQIAIPIAEAASPRGALEVAESNSSRVTEPSPLLQQNSASNRDPAISDWPAALPQDALPLLVSVPTNTVLIGPTASPSVSASSPTSLGQPGIAGPTRTPAGPAAATTPGSSQTRPAAITTAPGQRVQSPAPTTPAPKPASAGPYRWSPALVDVTTDVTADTIWTLAGSPYRLTGDVAVRNGATLTIDPGVVVQAARNTGLYVQPGSRLVVSGATDTPIRFTASVTNAEPGWWAGIRLLGADGNPNTSRLNFAIVEFAGVESVYDGGSASTNAGVTGFRFGGVLNSLVVQNGSGDGLSLDMAAPQTFANLTLRNNSGRGLVLLRDSILTGSGLRVSGNGRTGHMQITSRAVFTGFVADGNMDQSFAIEGETIGSDTTLQNLGVPWALGSITIGAGATLTVEAGTTLLFARNSQLRSNPGSRLVANGSANAPVRFTANSADPQPNWWAGIQLIGDGSSANTSSLTNTIVEYAGYTQTEYRNAGNSAVNPNSVLTGYRFGGTLDRVTLQRGGDDGLWLDDSTPQLMSDLTIRRNGGRGLVLLASTSFDASNVRVDSNARVGYLQLSARPAFTNFSAADNADSTFAVDGGAVSGDLTWQFPGASLAVGDIELQSGSTLTITAGTTLRFGQNSHLLANQGSRLIVSGTLASPVRFTANITSPTPGWWAGIQLYGDSGNPNTSSLNFATIEYAGVQSSYYDGGWTNSRAGLTANRFNGILNGLTLERGSGEGLWLDQSSPKSVGNLTIKNNSGRGLVLLRQSAFSAGVAEVSGNGQTGYMDISSRPSFGSFFADGNVEPSFAVGSGTIYSDTTWQNLGIPWAPGSVSLNAGITLTVEAGTTLRFGQNAGLLSNPGSRLVVGGTTAAPVRFTANITNPTAGWWAGIQLIGDSSSANASRISNATIEYAGVKSSYYDGGWSDSYAGLTANRFVGTIDNLTIQQGSGDGLWLDRSTPSSLNGLALRNNAGRALVILRDTAFTADGARIGGNGRTGYMHSVARPVFTNLVAEGDTDSTVGVEGGSITSDTTWQFPGVALTSGSISIQGGAALTISQGTIIRFDQNAGLLSNPGSRLVIGGTASAPVRFSANTSNPQPGWWTGVRLLGDSGAPNTSSVSHAIIEFAGGGNSYYDGGWVDTTAGLVANRFTGSLNDLTIQRGSGDGVWLDLSTPQPIAGLTIQRNGGRGMVLRRETALTANNVEVKNNGRTGYMSMVARPVFTNFVAQDNTDETFAIETGTVVTNTTWQNLGVPWAPGTVNIASGVALTVEAGSALLFGQGSRLVSGAGSRLVVSGTLNAPVRISANTPNPAPGYWAGIQLLGDSGTSNNSRISYATIEYAGSGNSYYDVGWVDTTAGLTANRFAGILNNVTIQRGGGDGLWLDLSTPETMRDVIIKSNAGRGMALRRQTAFAVNSAEVSGNGRTGYMDLVARPTFGSFIAEGNVEPSIGVGDGTVISDTTWQNLGVPWAPGAIALNSGVTLTIEAGNTLRFSQNGRLTANVGSRLVVSGTAAAPVRFTANITNPTPGYWAGIQLLGDGSAPNHSSINYGIIEYAGSGNSYYDVGWHDNSASLTTNRFAGILNNVTVQRGGGDGLWMDWSIPERLQDIVIKNNAGKGLQLKRQTSFNVNSMEVSGNGQTGYMDYLARPTFGSFIAEGNVEPAFAIGGGTIVSDTVWQNLGVPWAPEAIILSSGVTLTIEAGNVLRFSQNSRLASSPGSRLVVSGTAAAPVRFTANITNPTPGYWAGVQLLGDSGAQNNSSVNYATIEYAGSGNSYFDGGWHDNSASLTTNRFAGILNNVTVQRGGGDGLWMDVSTPELIKDIVIRNNAGKGLQLKRQTSFNVNSMEVSGNGQTGYMDYLARPTFGSFIAEGNTDTSFSVGSGTIVSDTVWQNLGVPWAPGTIAVNVGVTFTIEAGNTIRFSQNSRLTSNPGSRLIVSGTVLSPVRFTANVTNPTPGYWVGIQLLGDSGAANKSSISQAIVEYVGSGGSYYDGGWQDHAAGVAANRFVGALDNLTIQRSAGDGLWLDRSTPGSAAGLVVRDNAGRGLVLLNGTTLTASDVRDLGNGGTGYMHANSRPFLSGFLADGSAERSFLVSSGSVTTDTTWPNIGVPWAVTNVGVNDGAALTIEAGATVKFAGNGLLASRAGSRLVVSGTYDLPVRFTANVTNPTPGWWNGILIEGDSGRPNTSSIQYAVVEYAGSKISYYNGGWVDAKAGIVSSRWGGTLEHTIVQFTDGAGVWLDTNRYMALKALGLRNNSGAGLKSFGWWGGYPSISDSNLYRNGGLNIEGAVYAPNNYWGSPNGPASTAPGAYGTRPWRSWPAKIIGASIDITPPPPSGNLWARPGDSVNLVGNEFDCPVTCTVQFYWDFVDPGQDLGTATMEANANSFNVNLVVPDYAEPGAHDIVGVLLDEEGTARNQGKGSLQVPLLLLAWPVDYPPTLTAGTLVTITWAVTGNSSLSENRLVWDTISHSNALSYTYQLSDVVGEPGIYTAQFTIPVDARDVFYRIYVRSGSDRYQSPEYGIGKGALTERTVGVLTVWADSFTPNGEGFFADGNVAIGANHRRYFTVDKPPNAPDSVHTLAITGTAFAGTGTVSFATGVRRPLWVGALDGDGASGSIRPGGAVSYTLAELMGRPLSPNGLDLSLDAKTGWLSGNGRLTVALPENVVTPTLDFRLNQYDTITGTFGAITLTAAGMDLRLTSGTLERAGLRPPTATLSLPASMGGGVADLGAGKITRTGLRFDDASFDLPRFNFGGAGALEGRDVLARLAVNGGNYAVLGDGTLHVELPEGNTKDLEVAFQFQRDGSGTKVGGYVKRLDLNIAGAPLSLSDLSVTNSGLVVGTARMGLPPAIASNSDDRVTLSNVAITKDGLRIAGGSSYFRLPDITLGSGMHITNVTSLLAVDATAYRLDISGTMHLGIPGNNIYTPVSLSARNTVTDLGTRTDITGTIAVLSLNVAGGTLSLSNLSLSNSGLRVANATLSLPTINVSNAQVSNVAINTRGELSIGGGTVPFDLPNFTFGSSGASLGLRGGKATLAVEDSRYSLYVSGTFTATLPDNNLSVDTLVIVHPDGSVTGNISRLAASMAGGSLLMRNLTLSNSGLTVATANLSLPAINLSNAAVYNVSISTRGDLTIGGGSASFDLPGFVVGSAGTALGVSHVKANLVGQQTRYSFTITGTLSASLLDSRLTSNASLTVDADGNMAGRVTGLTLNVAGGTLGMTDLTLNNNGLSVSSAELRLPRLNISSVMLSNVAVSTSGQITVGGSGATFDVPNFAFGDSGASLRMTGARATLINRQNKFGLSVNGSFVASLPGSTLTASDTTITVSGDGAVSGTVARLTVSLAGGTLDMANLALSWSGLAVETANLTFPSGFPIQKLGLTKVAISTDGRLTVGGGSVSFDLPTFSVGSTGASLSVKDARATLVAGGAGYTFSIAGTLTASLLDSVLTSSTTISIDSSGNWSGSVASLTLNVAGGSLIMNNLTVGNTGLFVSAADLRLPNINVSSLTLSDVAISTDGQVTVGGGGVTINLPNFTFGTAGTALHFDSPVATLTKKYNKFALSINGTFRAELPGNSLTVNDTTVTVYGDGAVAATLGRLTVGIAGGTLDMRNLSLSSSGLWVKSADLTFPSAFYVSGVTLREVTIGADGSIGIGGGGPIFRIPDFYFGSSGSSLSLSSATATIVVQQGKFTFSIAGTFGGSFYNTTLTSAATISIDSNGAVSGSVDSLSVSVAGYGSLSMSSLAVSNSGLQAARASLSVPALNLTNAELQNVVFDTRGQITSIGGGGLGFSLPAFSFGSAVGFSNPRASLFTEGGRLGLAVDGTFSASLPDNNVTIQGSLRVDTGGNLGGRIDDLNLALPGGLSLGLTSGQIESGGGLYVGSASLQLPSSLGGLSTNVRGLRISTSGGLSVEGGKFALPSIDTGLGGFKIRDAMGEFSIADVGGRRYIEISGAGAFSIEGAAELTVSFTIGYNDAGSLSLKNACLGIRSLNPSFPGVPLPPPESAFYLTGVEGCVELRPDVSVFRLTVTVEVEPRARIGGYSTLWGTIGATYRTAGDPAVSLAGTIHAFSFQLAEASIDIARSRPDFKVTAKITLGSIVEGGIRVHVWYVDSIHMTGSIWATIHLSNIPLPDWAGWMRVFLKGDTGASLDFGEFARDGGGTTWGVKYVLKWGDKAVGSLFWGVDSGISVSGGAGDTRLIDQFALALRPLTYGEVGVIQGMSYSSAPQSDGRMTQVFTRTITSTTPLVVNLTWQAGEPALAVYRPNGQRVVSDTVTVLDDRSVGNESYAIQNPEVGPWTFVVSNLEGGENYRLQTISIDEPRRIQSVSIASASPPVVSWTLTSGSNNPSVSVYVDTDSQNYDGTLMATNLSGGNVALNTSALVSGTYYVYLRIDDGATGFDQKYASRTLTVSDGTPPAVPLQFGARPVAQGVEVAWRPPSENDLAGYTLGFGAGPTYTETLTLGLPSADDSGLVRYALQRTPGSTTQIAIRSYDVSRNYSAWSSPVSVTVPLFAVQSLAPASGSRNVSRTGNLTVTFNSALDPTSVVTGNVYLRGAFADVPLTVGPLRSVVSPSLTVGLVVTPQTTLAEGASYEFIVAGGLGGIRSEDGRTLADSASVAFTTQASPPTPAFSLPAEVRVGQVFTPTNATTGVGQVSYLWNFGDGTTSDNATPSHRFTTAGYYTVGLTATNLGGSSAISQTVRAVAVLPALVVTKTGRMVVDADGTGQLSPGDTVEWTIAITNTGEGPLLGWVLTDTLDLNTTLVAGSVASSRQANVITSTSAIFLSADALLAGDKVVITFRSLVNREILDSVSYVGNRAWVSGSNQGETSSVDPADSGSGNPTRLSLGPPPPPTASFVLPAEIRVGRELTVTNTTSGAGQLRYRWDFGDGATSDLITPTHQYTIAGGYNIELTASNLGGSSRVSQTVTVLDALRPRLYLPVLLRAYAGGW